MAEREASTVVEVVGFWVPPTAPFPTVWLCSSSPTPSPYMKTGARCVRREMYTTGAFSDRLISFNSTHDHLQRQRNRLPSFQMDRTSTCTRLLAKYPSVETAFLSAFYAIFVRGGGGLKACDWPARERVQMTLALIGFLSRASSWHRASRGSHA